MKLDSKRNAAVMIAIAIILSIVPAFGQAVRVDTQVTTIGVTPPTGANPPIFGVPNASIALCSYPANGQPCTNFATSYTDNTQAVSCPQSAPVVLNGTNTCVSTTDAAGNFGFWVASGAYSYMMTTESGITYGPYFFTAGTGGTLSGFLPLSGGTMTGQINLVNSAPSGQNAVSFNYVTGNFCTLGTSGCALTGSLSFPNAVSTNSFNHQFVPNTTIANAFANAGNTGSVFVPANYGAQDAWQQSSLSNLPAWVRMQDMRPVNPTNSATESSTYSGSTPGTTVKAVEFGAKCDGYNDDTAAIQQAVASLVGLPGYIAIAPPFPYKAAVVELPQGRCVIRSPIILGNYASLEGSANGTTLSANEPWTGSGTDNAMVIIRLSFDQAQFGSDHITTINRFVRGINFVYGGAAHAIAGIKVYNQTGSSASFPYPVGAFQQNYQPLQVDLAHNTFYLMDTGIDLEDCGECVIEDTGIDFTKTGIAVVGNDYNTVIQNTSIDNGSLAYTSNSSGLATGIFTSSAARYGCTGGSGPTCSGGTIGQTVITSPQSLGVYAVGIENYDNDANFGNMLDLKIDNSSFDLGAAISGTATSTVFIGLCNWVKITNSFITSSRTDSFPLEIAAATANPTDDNNLDGLWITNDYIFSYNQSSAAGIVFDSGSFPRRNVYLDKIQISKLAQGILFNSPITYSSVTNIYGFHISGSLIDFTSAGPWTGTQVNGNTTSDGVPAYFNPGGGSGLVIGYNKSASQLTGTQVATGSGCTTGSGAIGSPCGPVTMTIPNSYADSGYTVSGCMVTGASHDATVGTIGSTSAGSFTLDEIALTTSATSGGNITCNVNHQ